MDENQKIEERIRTHWEDIKETIRRECQLTNISYTTWIEPLVFLKYENETVYIQILKDNSVALDYVDKKFTSFLTVAIGEIAETDRLRVRYVLQDDDKKESAPDDAAEEQRRRMEARLNADLTFESFVVGSSNRFAYSAAVAVAEDPGNSYNPLFLYGGPGLGKTHLLQAIGNYIISNAPEKKVLYVTSEDFTNEVVKCVMKKEYDELHDLFRKVDVLMVDDVQFVIGKDRTQLEFFHAFNSLYQEGKQIVLSADRHPKEIKDLDERFRSRFEMGLTSDIQSPDYETRIAILRRLREGTLVEIEDCVLEYIANGMDSNVRELKGAFNKLVAYSRLNRLEHVGDEEAKAALRNDIGTGRARDIPASKIIDTVAEQFGVTTADLISRKRSIDIVLPR